MRLPVVLTQAHKGKALLFDPQRETVTLFGPAGDKLGTLPWESVINMILSAASPPKAMGARTEQRASLLVKVRYRTPDGKLIESRASGIGGGGLFIESTTPLRIGTHLTVELALPDRPEEWSETKCSVSWVCPKPDQYTFYPGMGVRFTEIAPDIRARILDLVSALNRSGPAENRK